MYPPSPPWWLNCWLVFLVGVGNSVPIGVHIRTSIGSNHIISLIAQNRTVVKSTFVESRSKSRLVRSKSCLSLQLQLQVNSWCLFLGPFYVFNLLHVFSPIETYSDHRTSVCSVCLLERSCWISPIPQLLRDVSGYADQVEWISSCQCDLIKKAPFHISVFIELCNCHCFSPTPSLGTHVCFFLYAYYYKSNLTQQGWGIKPQVSSNHWFLCKT